MINVKNNSRSEREYFLKFGMKGKEREYLVEKAKSITSPDSDELATQIAGFVSYDGVKNLNILVENMKEINETES